MDNFSYKIHITGKTQKEYNLYQLNYLSKLEDDWNGHGAKKFNQILLEKIKDIIEDLKYQPSIFPTARNSIQLEYETENSYLEFEIWEDKIKFMIAPWKDFEKLYKQRHGEEVIPGFSYVKGIIEEKEDIDRIVKCFMDYISK